MWKHEPDEHRWTDSASGYQCLVVRVKELGTLCGYVAVPQTHPWYGLPYNAIVRIPDRLLEQKRGEHEYNLMALAASIMRGKRVRRDGIEITNALAVHGGVTFSGFIEDFYCFGFDCCHAGDLVPEWPKIAMEIEIPEKIKDTIETGEYRTIRYVMEQCAKLAAQLKEIECCLSMKNVSPDFRGANQ